MFKFKFGKKMMTVILAATMSFGMFATTSSARPTIGKIGPMAAER